MSIGSARALALRAAAGASRRRSFLFNPLQALPASRAHPAQALSSVGGGPDAESGALVTTKGGSWSLSPIAANGTGATAGAAEAPGGDPPGKEAGMKFGWRAGGEGEGGSALGLDSLIQRYSLGGASKGSQAFVPTREKKVDKNGRSYGTGRRKASVARVWVTPTEGPASFVVNSKPMIEYFDRDCHKDDVLQPLQVTGKLGMFEVRCTVEGGGNTGQAGAVRLGLARALECSNPYLRPLLKTAGLLTRDSRVVERKKAGKKKARKSFQWVKR